MFLVEMDDSLSILNQGNKAVQNRIANAADGPEATLLQVGMSQLFEHLPCRALENMGERSLAQKWGSSLSHCCKTAQN